LRASLIGFAAASIFVGCTTSKSADANADRLASARPDSALIVSRAGFTQPEAVRYDPDQDVYFVSNFGQGDADAKDNNGFISRMTPDGQIQQLQFIAGGKAGVTLHAPRGMFITGDTLWVANFSGYKLGFLNDVAAGPDGEYVTDTGTNSIYRIANGQVTVALQDKTLGGPNGITWDAANRRFIVVPYGGDSVIRAWASGSKTLSTIGKSTSDKFDGVEILPGGGILVSSQGDSSLHLFTGTTGNSIMRVGGAPADIAVDTKRNRVAVPFVDRSIVEIWELPARN